MNKSFVTCTRFRRVDPVRLFASLSKIFLFYNNAPAQLNESICPSFQLHDKFKAHARHSIIRFVGLSIHNFAISGFVSIGAPPNRTRLRDLPSN